MKTLLQTSIQRARGALQDLGPLAALGVLPGGSLLLLAVWAYRQRNPVEHKSCEP